MKQSLAARFLFRVVVLAFLVYAMLLTWWTPFTGDSLMHSVFGADHRLAFQPVLERCWWSYMHWNPRLGGIPRYFYGYGGKMAFSGRQSLRASFPGVDDVFPDAGKKGQFRKLAGCAAVCRRGASFAYVFIQAGHHDVLAVRRDQLRMVGRHLAGFPVPVPLLMGRNFPDSGHSFFLVLDRRHGVCRRHDE